MKQCHFSHPTCLSLCLSEHKETLCKLILFSVSVFGEPGEEVGLTLKAE